MQKGHSYALQVMVFKAVCLSVRRKFVVVLWPMSCGCSEADCRQRFQQMFLVFGSKAVS